MFEFFRSGMVNYDTFVRARNALLNVAVEFLEKELGMENPESHIAKCGFPKRSGIKVRYASRKQYRVWDQSWTQVVELDNGSEVTVIQDTSLLYIARGGWYDSVHYELTDKQDTELHGKVAIGPCDCRIRHWSFCPVLKCFVFVDSSPFAL